MEDTRIGVVGASGDQKICRSESMMADKRQFTLSLQRKPLYIAIYVDAWQEI